MEPPLPTAPAPSSTEGTPSAGPALPPVVPFTMGAVIGRTFSAWGRSAHQVVLLAVLAHAPMALGTGVVYARTLGYAPRQGSLTFSRALVWGGWLVSIALVALAMAAIAHGTVRRLDGERPRLGEMLGAGLRRWAPASGLTLLVGLALGVLSVPFTYWLTGAVREFAAPNGWRGLGAFLTSAVPIAFLLCVCVAALPAVVEERLGPFRGVSRSWSLTRGHRWRIFGAFAVIALVELVILIVAWGGLAVLLVPFVDRAMGRGAGLGSPMVAIGTIVSGMQLLVGALASVMMVGAGVAYHGLRRVKEGEDPGRLGRVFE